MKIKICYVKGEGMKAWAVEEFVRAMFPGVETRRSENHPPYSHIYLTTKQPKKDCNSKKNT